MVEPLTNLVGLSAQLRLPLPWLRAEALVGRIPCLKIGRKLLFSPTTRGGRSTGRCRW
jgi:hypothetical protein